MKNQNALKIEHGILWAFREVLTRMPPKKQKQFWVVMFGMTIVAFFETATLGIVAFFASSLTNPTSIIESEYIKKAYETTEFSFLLDPRGLIVVLGILVIFLVPLKNVARGIMLYWINRYGAAVEVFFGEKLLGGFLYADYQWVSNRNTADLVLGVTWRSFLGRGFISPALGILSDLVVIGFLFLSLMIVDPISSFIAIIVMSIIAMVAYFRIRVWLDKITIERRDLEVSINQETTKAIHGIKDVKVTSTQEFFVKQFVQKANPLSRLFGLQEILKDAPVLFLESAGFIVLSGIVCFMLLVLEASMIKVVGVMALMGVAAWRILPAVSRIIKGVSTIRKALPYIEMEISYLDQTVAGNQLRERALNIEKQIIFSQKIHIKDIEFSYGDERQKPILYCVDFSIQKGQTVGVVGMSGAGKSTLVDLIIGLLDSQKGAIEVDDVELDKISNLNWVKHIGYVPQSPYIFDGTLARNIAFGIPEEMIDRDKILVCCKMASMDFLDDLPNGIDSELGERGIRLSGGQQQRVAIARALYYEPDVLIFDEATSSLDTRSEKAIQETIYGFKGKQTLVLIAHRLSTVKECDRILWLEKGTIKMAGTPDEVLPRYENQLAQAKLDL